LKKADYELSPVMEKINNSKVVLELIKRFRGNVSSLSLRDEQRLSPGLFFMKMGEVVKNVQGYYLSPGKLSEMADRVFDLIEKG
jgi:hypothetical protein